MRYDIRLLLSRNRYCRSRFVLLQELTFEAPREVSKVHQHLHPTFQFGRGYQNIETGNYIILSVL